MTRLVHSFPRYGAIALCFSALACASGKNWVQDLEKLEQDEESVSLVGDARRGNSQDRSASYETKVIGRQAKTENRESELPDSEAARPQIKLRGQKAMGKAPPDAEYIGSFRNTYYDFPAESEFAGPPISLMSASCEPLAEVPRDFYQSLCVQGSGTLNRGITISFAKRNCSCAAVCEKTNQKICFDALDAQEFPFGRGAQGTAITPLRTIAVDSSVIPLGTAIYIPEYDGIPRRPGDVPHDGCFIAEDRGMQIVGKHVDIFTGNRKITEHFNRLVPSNQKVHLYIGTARCDALL
ncbi:MAG: 3D domain-containing protein [Polyangiaceae bacterium]|nr:3D domain-containing protein [Polyangiaceae bacterium]